MLSDLENFINNSTSSSPKQFSTPPSSPELVPLDSSIGKHPRHDWTKEQKIVLCVLERWFCSVDSKRPEELSGRDRKDVFCGDFHDEFYGDPNKKPITRGALQSQIRQIFKDAGEAWKMVYCETTFQDLDGRWEDVRNDILAVAADLSIDLRQKTVDDIEKHYKWAGCTATHKRKRERERSSSVELGYPSDSSISEDAQAGASPRSKIAKQLGNFRLSSPSRRTHDITSHVNHSRAESPCPPERKCDSEKKPMGTKDNRSVWSGKVGYRFFDRSSQGMNSLTGFRAGAFLQGPLEAPEADDHSFGRLCNLHLRPLHEPSPFISVFHNFRPAFFRAIRSSENASIALIDMEYLGKMTMAGRPVLYWAGGLVRKYEIIGHSYETNKDYAYQASHESVVWGEIPSAAIIGGFSMADFHAHATSALITNANLRKILSVRLFERSQKPWELIRALKSVDVPLKEYNGTRVGEFLAFAGLSETAADAVAWNIALKWNFRGGDGCGKDIYMKGIRRGYWAYRNSGLPSRAIQRDSQDSPASVPPPTVPPAAVPPTSISSNSWSPDFTLVPSRSRCPCPSSIAAPSTSGIPCLRPESDSDDESHASGTHTLAVDEFESRRRNIERALPSVLGFKDRWRMLGRRLFDERRVETILNDGK